MKLARNIPVLYTIKIAKWLMLYMPIVILFYEENDIPDKQLFILHGIYSLIIAIWEVPSGIIADRWGRKPSMQLGTMLGAIGFMLYAFTHNYWGFLFAEIALGLGQGFISGADSALLYDTLYQQNRKEKYLHVEGRITALGNLSESMAGVLVSVLAFSVYRNYYYVQSFIAIIGFGASFLLVEPSHFKKLSAESNFLSNFYSTFKSNRKLRSIIIISSLFGLSSLSMAWFSQAIFKEIDLPRNWYGYGWTVLNLTVGIGSFFAGKVSKLVKPSALILILVIIFGVTFITTGIVLNYYTLAVVLLFYFARGIVHPVMKHYINELCSSDIRATVLSVRSLLIRVAFAALTPWLGVLYEKYTIQYALLLSGVVVIIPGIVFYFSLKNRS